MKSGSTAKLKIFGKVAQIHFNGETDKVFSGDMEMSMLSTQYFPITSIIPVIASSGHKLTLYFTNGKIIFRMIDNIPANTYIYVNATYLLNN